MHFLSVLRRLSVVALLCAAHSTFAQNYTITALGTLGGTTSYGYGVNANGQVAGASSSTAGKALPLTAFLYSGGLMKNLGAGAGSSALSINASGIVAGFSFVKPNSPVTHAFVTRATGGLIDLGTLGGPLSVANAINANGQVVGSSTTGGLSVHAFLINAPYTPNSMKDLGTLGGPISVATAINDRGQVVGTSLKKDSLTTHAFLINSPYAADSMQDLGSLGGLVTIATGINNSGQVVGSSMLKGNQAIHAFLLNTAPLGTTTDLGTLGGSFSQANAINAAGKIVGNSYTAKNAASHAFIYQSSAQGGSGRMVDLNTLIPATSGWVLNSATSIADNGTITGYGTFNGQTQAYLLVPAKHFAYVTNVNSNTVSMYTVNTDGTLSPLGSPVPTGSHPLSIAVAPSGRFAYVANSKDNTVSMYTVNVDGTLSPLGRPVPTGVVPLSIAVAPSGQAAYVANLNSNTVSMYTVNTDGTLSPLGSPVPTGLSPFSITVSPS
ncbi:beta-propeller fold lactonase family protein, partial [Paraburkholderia sp. RL17-373-BIF-A]|uniref:beta-propeller fold lactonase family protein n=1 Tax=Paraburkholderia sp. RL17-373-BIF-A TaxID=3031629 RepID=UPI0038BC3751